MTTNTTESSQAHLLMVKGPRTTQEQRTGQQSSAPIMRGDLCGEFYFMNTSWQWVRSIWSEPDGSGSSTRIHMTALISFVLGIGIAFGVATHSKRITIEQFDNFLNAGSTFIVTTCGPLYAANKAADWLKNKTNSQ
jgi:hypothetical protein